MIAILLALLALATCMPTNSTSDVDAELETGCNNHSSNEIQCCVDIEDILGFMRVDACADLFIDWENLNMTAALELNDVILFESTFGFDYPPELCTDCFGARICMNIYDMMLKNGELSGCVGIKIDNIQIELGCFSTEQP